MKPTCSTDRTSGLTGTLTIGNLPAAVQSATFTGANPGDMAGYAVSEVRGDPERSAHLDPDRAHRDTLSITYLTAAPPT